MHRLVLCCCAAGTLESNYERETAKRALTTGQRHSAKFEAEVCQELMLTILEKADAVEKLVVAASCLYTADVVLRAAKDVAARPHWNLRGGTADAGDKDVQMVSKLTYSDGWARKFIKRAKCRRKRISRQQKKRPAMREVQSVMRRIRRQIKDGRYTAQQIKSADETAARYRMGPLDQYVLESTQAQAPTGTDDK